MIDDLQQIWDSLQKGAIEEAIPTALSIISGWIFSKAASVYRHRLLLDSSMRMMALEKGSPNNQRIRSILLELHHGKSKPIDSQGLAMGWVEFWIGFGGRLFGVLGTVALIAFVIVAAETFFDDTEKTANDIAAFIEFLDGQNRSTIISAALVFGAAILYLQEWGRVRNELHSTSLEIDDEELHGLPSSASVRKQLKSAQRKRLVFDEGVTYLEITALKAEDGTPTRQFKVNVLPAPDWEDE